MILSGLIVPNTLITGKSDKAEQFGAAVISVMVFFWFFMFFYFIFRLSPFKVLRTLDYNIVNTSLIFTKSFGNPFPERLDNIKMSINKGK